MHRRNKIFPYLLFCGSALVCTEANAQSIARGMTWIVTGQQNGYVHVGSDSQTNPYSGDTSIDSYRRVLCAKVDGRSPPSGIAFNFYAGWLRGAVQATPPVQGFRLSSRAAADQLCSETFGAGWRMAEFHDGRYGPYFSQTGGWSFWGAGSLPTGTRFWTAIDDQYANPWNSVPPNLEQATDMLQDLIQPILGFSQNATFRNLVRSGAAAQFDGDDNVLLEQVISKTLQSGAINPYSTAWQTFVAQVASFQSINGETFYPQIYIPNNGSAIQSNQVTLVVVDNDESVEWVPAYRIDSSGNAYFVGYVDEAYATSNEVWVLSFNERVGSNPQAIAASQADDLIASEQLWDKLSHSFMSHDVQFDDIETSQRDQIDSQRTSPIPLSPFGSTWDSGNTRRDTQWLLDESLADVSLPQLEAVEELGKSIQSEPQSGFVTCNPTGIRNNKGLEYLKSFRIENLNKIEGWLKGKPELRLFIIGKGGAEIGEKFWGHIKRSTIKNGYTADVFVTTWDLAVWDDTMIYKWVEEDGGPTIEISLGLGDWINAMLGIPIGFDIKATFASKHDDVGMSPVLFNESTYIEYNTGTLKFNVCSMGGDGNTGNVNLALAATVSASSTYGGYSPLRAKDGSQSTALGGASSWCNSGYGSGYPPQWIQLDFGVAKTFSSVVVYTSSGYPIRDYDVQVYSQQTGWTTVAKVQNNTALKITSTFPTQNARLVRILTLSGPTYQPGFTRINEFEVY